MTDGIVYLRADNIFMDYFIDTHAHIYLQDFDSDRDDVMQRSLDAGVEKICLPNIDHTSVDAMLETEMRHPEVCAATMGLHPCSVKKDFARELYNVEEWLARRSFAAVGEIGTDLYWDKTFWDEQQEAFRVQVGWARQYDLPVIIHCRESLDQTIAMTEELQDGSLRGVFHCFGGTIEQATRIIAAGFYLGIGGIITFRKGHLDKVLKALGPDSMILETDSPYLAPEPYRGKRNEPSYIPMIARKLAEAQEIDPESIRKITTGNALKLFNGLTRTADDETKQG